MLTRVVCKRGISGTRILRNSDKTLEFLLNTNKPKIIEKSDGEASSKDGFANLFNEMMRKSKERAPVMSLEDKIASQGFQSKTEEIEAEAATFDGEEFTKNSKEMNELGSLFDLIPKEDLQSPSSKLQVDSESSSKTELASSLDENQFQDQFQAEREAKNEELKREAEFLARKRAEAKNEELKIKLLEQRLELKTALSETIKFIDNFTNDIELFKFVNENVLDKFEKDINIVAYSPELLSQISTQSSGFPSDPIINNFTMPILINQTIIKLTVDLQSPTLALSLFERCKKSDIKTFIYCCDTTVYNSVIDLSAIYFNDLGKIYNLLTEMKLNGIKYDTNTLIILRKFLNQIEPSIIYKGDNINNDNSVLTNFYSSSDKEIYFKLRDLIVKEMLF